MDSHNYWLIGLGVVAVGGVAMVLSRDAEASSAGFKVPPLSRKPGGGGSLIPGGLDNLVERDVFRTPVKAVKELVERTILPSGKVVTSVPLMDGRFPFPGMAARLDRVAAVEALAARGLVLPTIETVREIVSVGLWVPPVLLSQTKEDLRLSRTEEYCRRHDVKMWEELTASGWVGGVVSTFGKWHVAGAAQGDNRIAGWPKSAGNPDSMIQKGIADVHLGESLTDYATLTMGEEA